ncbi:hypothetical protein F4778DRAFT_576120 [Xylariomycetidae sp. FL2044]|nr:hypothetical protein F4778DRAFT_576120 [Xylariomycetidae sp. FL2044]
MHALALWSFFWHMAMATSTFIHVRPGMQFIPPADIDSTHHRFRFYVLCGFGPTLGCCCRRRPPLPNFNSGLSSHGVLPQTTTTNFLGRTSPRLCGKEKGPAAAAAVAAAAALPQRELPLWWFVEGEPGCKSALHRSTITACLTYYPNLSTRLGCGLKTLAGCLSACSPADPINHPPIHPSIIQPREFLLYFIWWLMNENHQANKIKLHLR